MESTPDGDLLDEFVRTGSEPAFGELVRRHVALVHSVAMRHTNQPHEAEEITQAVFILLARKAATLGRRTVLSGWLYHTARLMAANFRRAEFRRVHREQEAFKASASPDTPDQPDWRELAPLLDEAMARLGPTDRDAVVLRFFEHKNLADVGLALGLEERAAQKRVHRALEKLRKYFSRRGVISTTAILAGAISANSVQAAPAGLAQAVTAMAVAKGAAVSGSTLTLIKGGLKLMAWTKFKTAAVTSVVLLLAAGTTITTIKELDYYRMNYWRSHGITQAEIANLDYWPAQVWVKPAKNLKLGNQFAQNDAGKIMGRNVEFPWLLRDAYGVTQLRMILKLDPPASTFDFMANPPEDPAAAFQTAINQHFGVIVRHETVVTNALVLRVGNHGLRGFSAPVTNQWGSTEQFGTDTLTFFNQPLATMDLFLEDHLRLPIIDQTGITDRHKFSIKWHEAWWYNDMDNLPGLQAVLSDQLGLELVPTNMPIDMLVVEKGR